MNPVRVLVGDEWLEEAGIGVFAGFLMLSTLLNATSGSSIPSFLPVRVSIILAVGTIIISLLGSLIALRVALNAEPASVFH